ncbi:hypothetical protein [Agromyces sp. SYSU T00194]|uniref:hypothetical protein n=1 Tax=Agromyces chitinivorans TaxID=3158560 RepID=UPI0033941CCD
MSQPIPEAAARFRSLVSRGRVASAVAALPDVGLVPFLWLCVTVTAAIALHVFHPLLLVVVVVASVLTWRWRLPAYTARFAARSAGAAVLLVVAWVAINLPFAGEWIDLPRDPAFLAQAGIWLTEHLSPSLPVGSSADVVAAVPGAMIESNAYTLQGDVLQIQGAKLLPGLLAIPGWIGGVPAVLAGNVVIGGFALLCFYGFARRLLGPLWGLVALSGMAITVPMAYFSRSAFTEPLMMAMVFGGLTTLWVAFSTGDRRHYFVGGALIGAAGLARVDGALLVIGLVVALAAAVATRADADARAALRRGASAARIGAFLVLILGFAEMAANSIVYVAGRIDVVRPMLIGLAVVFVVGEIVSSEPVSGPPRRWVSRHRKGIALSLFAAVAAVGAVLVSRPLWMVSRQSGESPYIEFLQSYLGLPVEPDRNYVEYTVHWLSLYLGWGLVACGLLGLGAALTRAVLDSDRRLFLALCILGVPTLLYLVRPSIVADQVWAQRRFLAAAIPALVLFTIWLVRLLAQRAARSARVRTGVVHATVAVMLTALLVVPLLAWGPMFPVREHGGRLAQAREVCAALDGRPTVVLDRGIDGYVPTLRTVCGVDAVSFPGDVDDRDLASAVEVFGEGAVMLVAFDPERVPWSSSPPPATLSTTITAWPIALNHRAEPGVGGKSPIWIGRIGTDGTVVPVE